MFQHHLNLLTALTVLVASSTSTRLEANGAGSPCYELDTEGNEDLNKPQKCMPPFENVAAAKQVVVSPEQMTCGLRAVTEYCIQTHGIYRECDICSGDEADKMHPAEYLTDIHTESNQTWWQSVTMLEDVHTQPVNLTVNLGKAYDITYVRLKFQSPRPASFAIYKKNRKNPALPDGQDPDGGDWIPWQYYSATCRDTYKRPDSTSIIHPKDGQTKVNEDQALCTSDFSDMTPLTGGNVAFSTLEGRLSAFNFEYSPELQNWVSATDIRITLQRLNTFGDEVFGDPKVLRSYYYAITDFTVGGRCQCNGHARHCVENSAENATTNMICLCQHGTDGPNCETCLPDHWDLPWRRATIKNPNECKACECNGWSSRCRFNEQLFQETRRGGECVDCEGFRDGQHCERCLPNHFFSRSHNDTRDRGPPCEPCLCNPTGSVSLQCSEGGRCECKRGVTGDKCDRCAANHWNFGSLGCQSCGCLPEGSIDNEPSCDTLTGNCMCKQNVEGQKCDRCKAGHFHIDENNIFGCTPCFCYGHTSECELSGGYGKIRISSDFSRSDEGWSAKEGDAPLPLRYDAINKMIGLQAGISTSSSSAYFSAPSNYLGNQRASYNQKLSFRLRVNEAGVRPGPMDIVIEGGGSKRTPTRISASLTDQGNPAPGYEMQDYTFRLHENPEFGWSPRLKPIDFMAVLSNITALKIRGGYATVGGTGFLDEVRLESAVKGSAGGQATWIERCDCSTGYRGQFCEKCLPGYHHNGAGPFGRCLSCNCNGHADICDPETGECECEDNTDGHNCEKCAKGFYGTALNGTPEDCKPCPCPEGGACLEVEGNENSPICLECPEGRTGPRCERCEDSYYGDPMGLVTEGGIPRPCVPCECNNNVDVNAIGNCNGTTGECLRCIDNTDGFHCERCKSGFFGDALAIKDESRRPNCQPCQCYPIGTHLNSETYLPICNGFTGDCSCKPHVVGRDCDRCADGYFNLESGEGCEPCNCDAIGSTNATCDIITGQCNCNQGVTGQRCDTCLSQHFGFSPNGCKPCECEPTGSTDLQCDLLTGQCPCRDQVEGRRCDRCMENTRSKDPDGRYGEKVCEPCDDCYNLVSDAANEHRQQLDNLDQLLRQIAENPDPVGEDFENQLQRLRTAVTATLADARISSQNDIGATLRDRLEGLKRKLQEATDLVIESDEKIEKTLQMGEEAEKNVDKAKDVIEEARETLKSAQKLLANQGRDALRKAQERAKKFGEESEKMSAIAREARILAEQQVEEANEIASIAEQASIKSSSAYKMARDALEQQHRTENQIRVLEVQVNEMGDKLRTVQSLSAQTLRDSTDAYNEALKIYQQALALEVSEIDTDTLNGEANKIEEEAERLRKEAQRLKATHSQLLVEVQDHRVKLSNLLERASVQQDGVNAQLADMKEHRKMALDAVEAGNGVLQDAANTLETLQDFENRVTQNRQIAFEALKNIEMIEKITSDARSKSKEAEEAMSGADTSANLALTVAIEAERISQEASTAASEISRESSESKELAIELVSATNSLTTKLSNTMTNLEQKENVSQTESEAALTALSMANQAQTKARKASIKVEEAKKELDDIAAILSTVQDPEPGLLEELARRVEIAEGKFQAADLDLRLRDLEAARQRQVEQVRDMSREVEYMKQESLNIQEIKNSLPDFCPKSNELCLEDQC